MDHDEVIDRIIDLKTSIDEREVVVAFVASLASRNLRHRSALGSYAIVRHLPPHLFTACSRRNWKECAICGLAPPIDVEKKKEWFERVGRAPKIHTDMLTNMLVLDAFEPAGF